MAGRLRAGTSGWSYDKWRGNFYPEDLPKREDLEYYARQLDCVEVNNTFYRLPSEAALNAWRDRTPDDFRFVLKGSRYVTHRKKLKDAAEHVPLLMDRVHHLAEKCAMILWQLPPGWTYDGERLRAFLDALPESPPVALEFREKSWLNDECKDLLEAHGVAFVIHDHKDLTTPEWVTAERVYLRFHGPEGDYRGRYGAERLAPWRRKAEAWRSEGREVWAFFNNDADGWAPWDALALLAGEEAPSAPAGARAAA